MNNSVLIFFLEGLLSVENPQRDRFTLIAWLLFQAMPAGSPAELLGEFPDLLQSNQAAVDALQAVLDRIAADFANCPGGTDCRATASESLMVALEAYLPRIMTPPDWRIGWMGVEG